MAEPAYAYKNEPQRIPELQPVQPQRLDLRVVTRTGGQRQSAQAIIPFSTKITLAVALVIVVSAVFINIWMANGTMRMLVTTRGLEQEIANYRAESHRLESRYSAMTNPQTIQRQAEELGMVPDPDPEYMRITDDPEQLAWDPNAPVETPMGSAAARIGASIGPSAVKPSDPEVALEDIESSAEAGPAQGVTD
jgi:cell division protein FtsL